MSTRNQWGLTLILVEQPPDMNSWVCKFCSNVNFWQRTKCNMRTCMRSFLAIIPILSRTHRRGRST